MCLLQGAALNGVWLVCCGQVWGCTREVLPACCVLTCAACCVCLLLLPQDLQQHPRNGWSLLGLLQVSKAGGSLDQREAQQQWKQAWADAEVQIGSSCPALSAPFPV